MAKRIKQRPLHEQVIVITGASSGIGLATALEAAERGAALMLAARSEETLAQVAKRISALGAEVETLAVDVRSQSEIERLAEAAIRRYGRIDTWINNAGVSSYGRIIETAIEEQRQLFETNYWGLVYGSLEAVKHLRERGGTIINLGSTVSDRAIPLQGVYSASKHAVKGFTDALRMELEAEGLPIIVTLIKPGAIHTPYAEHAANHLNREPQNAPPLYAPEVAARGIVFCAEHPRRDIFIGSGGKMLSLLGQLAPRMADKMMEKRLIAAQHSEAPVSSSAHKGIEEASGEGRTSSQQQRPLVRESSLYTAASMRPKTTTAGILAAGLAVGALLKNKKNARSVRKSTH